MSTASDIMTKKNIPLLHAKDSFSKLLNITSKSNLGLAIIMNDKKRITGVISDGDIKRIMRKRSNTENIKLDEVMTKKPCIVAPMVLTVEALEIMEAKNINAVPVVDKNQILGILTLKDIIKSIK